MTRITGTWRDDLLTFMIVSRRILLKMRNISDKLCGENHRPWQDTDDNIVWGMRCASWITKATNTGSEYVILIAFPWQKSWNESYSMLRYSTLFALSDHIYIYMYIYIYIERERERERALEITREGNFTEGLIYIILKHVNFMSPQNKFF
jgi:hypothetical protein